MGGCTKQWSQMADNRALGIKPFFEMMVRNTMKTARGHWAVVDQDTT